MLKVCVCVHLIKLQSKREGLAALADLTEEREVREEPMGLQIFC